MINFFLFSNSTVTFNYRYLFLPIIFLFLGANNILYNFVNSEKKFQKLAKSSVIFSAINNSFSLIFSFVPSIGLFFGELIGRFYSTFYLSKILKKDKLFLIPYNLSIQKYTSLIKKYKKFPFFSLPADFLDFYTKQTPIYILTFLNLTDSIGYYALTNKILSKPIMIIGRAVSVTFRIRAAQDYNSDGNCRPILYRTLLILVSISIVPFIFLYFFSIEIFVTLFGPEWIIAGRYTKIMIPLFFMQFITSPITYIFHIAGKQKIDFYLHIFSAGILSVCFFYGFYQGQSVEKALYFYTFANCFNYFLYLFLSIKFSKV